MGRNLSRVSLFKELADFFSFKTRRLILLALVISSVIPGTFYWHMPAAARWWFFSTYMWLVTIGVISQTGFFMQFAKAIVGVLLFGRRYKPVPYSTPEIDVLARKMKVLGKVKVYATSNPWIEGPFTNALTSRVYVPTSWMESFPKSEIIAVIGHEFAHITRRGRFVLEVTLAMSLAYAFAMTLELFTELILSTALLLLVFWVAQTAMALLLASFVSRRGEYRADLEGAKMTGAEGLISVFELVRDKLGGDSGSETHPPLSKRIRRLEALLDETE